MTYMRNGQQYIVVAVSGAGYSGELIAYRLPEKSGQVVSERSSTVGGRSRSEQRCRGAVHDGCHPDRGAAGDRRCAESAGACPGHAEAGADGAIRTRTTLMPGKTKFPLAAPAGVDSNAKTVAPAGAVNQGAFDPATWKFGPAFNPPAGAKIWNPVKLKMMQGGKVTGGTLFSATDPSIYCAMANAGYDFIWTEMQHGPRDWDQAARMWRTCPHARAVPGARVAYADEREIQHATDSGALVIVVPTVDTVEEAIAARNWTYFPPLGRRSAGGGQAFDAAMWGGVPGGYRATANDNIVLILMIETLEGLKNAEAIAKVPGRDGALRGERRSRQLHRLPAGHA